MPPVPGARPSNRLAVWAAVLVGSGALATFAGAFELLSNRHLPAGYFRYQPPWTVPVFVTGLVLLASAIVLGLVAIVVARRGTNSR